MKEEVISSGLTLSDWVAAGAVLILGIGVGRVVRILVTRRISEDDAGVPAAAVIGRLIGYVAVLGSFIYALSVLDVRLVPLLGAVGIGGIAVALAAQSVLANFLGAVILQVRRPFRRGDEICTHELEGRVEEVNFRTVVIRTYDGRRVFVPCASVLNSPIENYTVLGRRRTTVTIAVSYEADLAEAQRVLLDAVAGVEGVLATPEPEVLVECFAESGIELAVRWWHAPDVVTLWRVRSEVAIAAKSALEQAGITIPFPQRVLHLRERETPPEGAGS